MILLPRHWRACINTQRFNSISELDRIDGLVVVPNMALPGGHSYHPAVLHFPTSLERGGLPEPDVILDAQTLEAAWQEVDARYPLPSWVAEAYELANQKEDARQKKLRP